MSAARCLPLALALLVAEADAGQLHVPGTYPDVQSAIEAAAPGDVIVVSGGTYGPITIDRPVTIVGDPAPLLVGAPASASSFGPAVTLAGPGFGSVVLADVVVGGTVDGFIYGSASPGITGGGFAELHVRDSSVSGPTWQFLTGGAQGQPGISVDLPFLSVERSTVTGARSDSDGTPGTFAFDGPPGLSSTGDVLVLDSVVTGGDAGDWSLPPGPCFCPPAGLGGPGVVCDDLVDAASPITAGSGARWFDEGGTLCCQNGTLGTFVATTRATLANDLSAVGAPHVGSSWTLSWSLPGTLAWMFASAGLEPPLTIPGVGRVFLDAASMVNVAAVTPIAGTAIAIPPSPALVGFDVAVQLVSDAPVVSRPVSATLLP